MHCKSCGHKLPDGASFCQSCGATTSNRVTGKSAANKKGVFIFAVVVLMLVWLLLSGRGYKTTLKQYVEATMEGNAKKIVALMPSDFAKYAVETGEYASKAEIIDDLDETLDYTIDAYEECFGKRMRYDYRIDEVYRYSADEMEQYFYYYDYGGISRKVDAVMEVTYTLELSGNGEEYSGSETIMMYKIGRNWYLVF